MLAALKLRSVGLVNSVRHSPDAFHVSALRQILQFSNASSSSKHSGYRKTQQEIPRGQTDLSMHFNEITRILGSDILINERSPSGIGIPLSKDGDRVNVERKSPSCRSPVCENDRQSNDEKKMGFSVLEGSTQQTGGFRDENEVSRVVDQITNIVRADNGSVSMEERLGNLHCEFDSGIVENVLKRCFKVPHLGLRFFDWVKFKDGFRHTVKTYNAMLYIAGEAKAFGVIRNLVEEMDKNSIKGDVSTWTILISQYGKAKQTSEALIAFETMKKCGCEPDAMAYRAIITSLCGTGKAGIAMEFYKEMLQKNILLDVRVYKMLLNCLARSGDIAAVRSIADDMMRISMVSEETISKSLLKTFCISCHIKEALELIRDIKNKGLPVEPEHFETLLRGLCRADRMADALEIFDIMKRKQIINGKAYGFLIHGYLKRNDIDEALHLFHSMQECGHIPLVSTYTELIQHLFRHNKYEYSCRLYDEMLAKEIKPDSVVITAMVAGHVSQNHMSEAWKLLKSMGDLGIEPSRKFYSVFIKELYKASRINDILHILQDMRTSKTAIWNEVFHWAISFMKNKGETDALEKVKQMHSGLRLNLLQDQNFNGPLALRGNVNTDVVLDQSKPKIADGLIKDPVQTCNQDLQQVCGILSSSSNWSVIQEKLEKGFIQYTPELVLEILCICEIHGNAALKFFTWVGKQSGYKHTTETYNMAIKIAGRAKDFKHMRDLFYEMQRRRIPIASDTWTIMISSYGRTGLTQMALNTFAEMKANGFNPTGSTYKCLIISLSGRKGRKVENAIKLFQEMLCAGYIPDKELLETYLGCLCEDDKLLDARKCVDSLEKLGYTFPLRYSLYVRALCRAGRLEEALLLFEEFGADKLAIGQSTCGSIVHGLLRKGQFEEAVAKIDAMKKAGISPTVHVYTSLMVHLFKERQIHRAYEVFKKMQEEGFEPTIITYSALIRGYMNVGKVTDAWDIFNRMKLKGPLPDFKTYSMFIACLCRVGRSEEAMQLIPDMLNSRIVPSTVNFRTIFFGLNREGKQDLARRVLQQKSELTRKRKFVVTPLHDK